MKQFLRKLTNSKVSKFCISLEIGQKLLRFVCMIVLVIPMMGENVKLFEALVEIFTLSFSDHI